MQSLPFRNSCPAGLVRGHGNPGQVLVKTGQRTQWFDPIDGKEAQIKTSCQDLALVACVVRHLRQVQISVSIFLQEMLLLLKFSFSGPKVRKAKAEKHSRRCAGRVRSTSHIIPQLTLLVSSSSRFLHKLCHIHRCNLTVNSSSDLVILSACKHLLNDSSSLMQLSGDREKVSEAFNFKGLKLGQSGLPAANLSRAQRI